MEEDGAGTRQFCQEGEDESLTSVEAEPGDAAVKRCGACEGLERLLRDLSVELRSKNQLLLDRISNLMDDVDGLKLKISQLVAPNEGAGVKKRKKKKKNC